MLKNNKKGCTVLWLKNKCFFSVVILLLLCSCHSIKQPESVAEPLDYTDEDVIENEKKNIHQLLERESVKALFRACLLNDSQIITECAEIVHQQAQTALENKEYTEALRLYKSLVSSGYEKDLCLGEYEAALQDYYSNVPGFSVNESKLPGTISDCINATVTVWVDKGYKVENGAGYADIVIGSGFFIDDRGYIITNHHVIEDVVDPKRKTYSRVYVKLPSDMETKIPAKIIGYDSVMDLALLKVEYEPDFVFALGSSADLSVGDKISAIGTPIGLEGTLTSGIISSTSRTLLTMGNVFQIDAAVNSGNSGGPIIDSKRTVQAIVFAGMLQYQGLNFAIPVEYLKQDLPLLYRGEKLTHSWTAGYGHTKRLRNEKLGLEVQYVIPGGSLSYSKIKADDIITKVDGNSIKSIEDFQFVTMKYEPGTILTCEYIRDDELCTGLLYLEKRPDAPLLEVYNSDFVENAFIPIFGIKMVRSSTTNKKSYKIEYVINGSIADQNGFSENDSLVLHDVTLDNTNKYLYASVVVQRRKKGFIDIQMGLAASYDNPNYF